MYQEKLISAMYRRSKSNHSLIEEVASALAISYDAAHRRLSMKSKFSMEEAIALAKHFDLSMDNLFQSTERVLVKKTREIQSFDDLSRYLASAYQALQAHPENYDTSIYYSAKDIPLFYTIKSGILSKFKLFVWLNLLTREQENKSFESFQIQTPILENSNRLIRFYDHCSKHEIWNDTTINSTLQQIVYFFQSGLLAAENAFALCESIKELIYTLEKNCHPKNEEYRLYYHDLLILNNNVLVTEKDQQSLFVPYTMLGYFITQDRDTCSHAKDFFLHQIQNSKLLNTAGTRDKKIFFNRAYQKIDFYQKQIAASQEFDYL
ncbi:hypothetical protein PQ465_14085 [Sphingobacterium oryzagri]|uniref:BetR domain-containing protein n=1 Tax=Sphingobacterium oryzagri TaxID=3025669 RepID=A0ABY7WCN9_9SPHI|nr:hypothetical protein [Sphingobacterium sp. KACC 22765]WDF67431.1 hypothetical protein PQ465_14085 [Sphingobacterium sp. KACC 22765]